VVHGATVSPEPECHPLGVTTGSARSLTIAHGMDPLSTDDVLLGLGLVLVLAIGSQILARRFRLPAIVVLLPVGFAAGIVTDDVHPDALLGQLYQPFVSLAVGVILFEAGLRLSLTEIERPVRRLVGRLVAIGVPVTCIGIAVAVALLIDGVSDRVALLLGAVLVVSGPTVVLPLLAFVRPAARIRSLLTWEGVLVDPVGALLGVLVFHVVSASGDGWHPGETLISVAVGAAIGAAAAAILWLLLRETQQTAPRQAVPAVLMMVIAALVVADLLREDAGFVATTLMGVAFANQHRIDVSLTLEFQGTLVQLLIGVLFVLIAASVTPSAVDAVLPEALLLVVVMALVIRPLAVALATWGSDLTLRERAFVAWMAPRGIVAGATASAFGLSLTQAGVPGAENILPIAFVAIFGTVVLYGLTAGPVAKLLGVAGRQGIVVLVVGGSPFAREAAAALQRVGVRVRLWVGRDEDQRAARAMGLEVDRGSLMHGALTREAELEDVTDALLLSRNDDFNALAAAELRVELGHGHVFRAASDPDDGDLAVAPGERGILAGGRPTSAELDRCIADGWRLIARRIGNGERGHQDAQADVSLFVVRSGGAVHMATDGPAPPQSPGDTVITLSPAGSP
jgi:NhaP-type Na+/H+ or K+/H+ antiporter